ncbi:glycerol transport system ATP-binding protein [Microvirga lupini]|uniref:Glycerol transport system ATP-binding protein n=1 Tax=Microvirga lupini TaxID=420324 RepID=A0A7W4VIT5_9HYPH|nr:ABC transporter ATP-binding protein [Microvirga lupini]MBB3017981.1 glycerol transport system ATP-binding protein [Microvirga lupini]
MTLVLDGVSKKVGASTHIEDVNLTLERGSLNVLLGATLSGKTSLMRLMAGLDAPTSGRVLVEGQDVTGWPVQRRSVAMVYQQFINYPSLTVYENIASPLRVSGASQSEVDARVRDAAKLLKLEPYLDRKPLNLSGGQQQRTAIARALVKRADLVLLDEPLANLDYKLREELREELPRVFAASGAIFVYATTEPSEALLLGGNTATLFQGRMTQFGPTPQVYRQPHDLITARVFSDPPLNTLKARKADGSATLSTGGQIPATGPLASVPDGEYTVGFRAHHLSLDPTGAHEITIPATVSVAEITGSESYVHLDADDHRFVALVPGVRRLEPKSPVTAYLDPRRLFLFDADGRLAAADPAQKAA